MKNIFTVLIIIMLSFSCNAAKGSSSTELGERFVYEQQVPPSNAWEVVVITDIKTSQKYLLITRFGYSTIQLIKLEKDSTK